MHAFLITLGATVALMLTAHGAFGTKPPRHARQVLKLGDEKLPRDFLYGCGTSAYQIEGAWNEDGKGPSIWDRFAQDKGKKHVHNDETGNVAMDFYHTYKEDIPLFVDKTGINNYDYTIAWTRILPTGRGTTPNKAGIEFYQNVNHATHAAGASASCTLYHWDLPVKFQDEYGGWLSPKILDDFENYARVAFKALGDSCDTWVSMNEPRTFCSEGYGPDNESAPGHKGSIDDVYKCVHHALLAHGRAHKVFKELRAQGVVRGDFGIKIDGGPGKPYDANSEKDKAAALRHGAFEYGWTIRPLTKGDYPPEMRKTMGKALPSFSEEESATLKDSYDIIYFDAYTSTWVKHVDEACDRKNDDWPACLEYPDKNSEGKMIGNATGSEWNFATTDTIYQGLHEMHDIWGAKALAVGENGLTLLNSEQKTKQDRLNDVSRINWYRSSLTQVHKLLKENFPIKGFVYWSCISNFEWSNGYEGDFGVIYAKPGKGQPREPKKSAGYLKGVFREGASI